MNLIDNAIKYTPAGGITVTLTGDKEIATVSVNDTGPGIAQEDIPHLFQKFYRVDSSATRTVGGTGLGLYLCRSIIELYNGRIWVESTVGKGSSFIFSLPRLDSAKVAAIASAAPVAAVVSVQPATAGVLAPVAPVAVSTTPVPDVSALTPAAPAAALVGSAPVTPATAIPAPATGAVASAPAVPV